MYTHTKDTHSEDIKGSRGDVGLSDLCDCGTVPRRFHTFKPRDLPRDGGSAREANNSRAREEAASG